jgi:hypothetical protein
VNGFVIAQGTTFILGVELRDRFGALLDLTGALMTAQMKDGLDNLIATFAVMPVANRPGVAQIACAADTSTWVPGRYRTDLRVVWPSGLIQQTASYTVTVIEGVTEPEPPA